MNNINELAQQIYQQNKEVGWWDDPNRCIHTTMQLVSTEIAEATEGERKNLMDDHLPDRKMGEVELADALIRVLDIGGKFSWNYFMTQPAHSYLFTESIPEIGKQHLACNMVLCELAKHYDMNSYIDTISAVYSSLVNTILKVGEMNGYDIMPALYEKLEYNKHRADHKRENRAEEHGKKF